MFIYIFYLVTMQSSYFRTVGRPTIAYAAFLKHLLFPALAWSWLHYKLWLRLHTSLAHLTTYENKSKQVTSHMLLTNEAQKQKWCLSLLHTTYGSLHTPPTEMGTLFRHSTSRLQCLTCERRILTLHVYFVICKLHCYSLDTQVIAKNSLFLQTRNYTLRPF